MANTPPSSVRIGPFTYSISPMSPMEATKHGLFGWHHWPSLDIRYRDDVSPQQVAHVLMHEILHGVWYTHEIGGEKDDREVEEEYVTRLATSLCDLIRSNPEMIAWISQTMAGEGETFLQTAKDVASNFPLKAPGGNTVTMGLGSGKATYEGRAVSHTDSPSLWA